MKPPYLPSFSDSLPVPQVGQRRGSEPSSRGRKDVVGQHLVEGVEHLGDAQILDLVDMAGKIRPEAPQHVLPGDLAGRNLVELLFEPGGEAVFDISGEKALEEGGDHAAAVLGDQRALFEPHIIAVLQDRRVEA